jgi:uncharacterized protein YrrD
MSNVMNDARKRRVSEYLGKPIVSGDTGEKVGTVADVLVDAHAGRIVGLIVSGGLLTSEHVLPYADVQVMGGDAVIARSRQHIIGAREWREGGSDALRSKTYKDKRVMTTGGRELGTVRDVYVNEHTGAVEAYDVAGRAFARLVERRSVLPQSADVTVGPDALIVSEDAAREFENPTSPN